MRDKEKEAARRKVYIAAHKEKVAEQHRAWNARNKEKVAAQMREAGLKWMYGITLTEYDDRLKGQSGVCKICGGVNPDGMRLSVDHDHKTGKVRGLLCSSCNSGLARFGDNIERLLKAAIYLEGDRDNG